MLELSESKSEGGKLSMPAWLGQGCSFTAFPFWSWLSLGRANSLWKGLFFQSRRLWVYLAVSIPQLAAHIPASTHWMCAHWTHTRAQSPCRKRGVL